MYSFEPNEEQQMLIDAVGKYAENDLRPAAHDAEESRESAEETGQQGLGDSACCKPPFLKPMAASVIAPR